MIPLLNDIRSKGKWIIYIDRSAWCVKKLPLVEKLYGKTPAIFFAPEGGLKTQGSIHITAKERERKKTASPHFTFCRRRMALKDAEAHVYEREKVLFCTDSALARSVIFERTLLTKRTLVL